MHFELSEEQRMLRQTVSNFVRKDSPVERFRKLRDGELGYDRGVWRKMAELGWLALPFAESIGGLGFPFVDVGLLLEQFGTTLVAEPYLASVVLAGKAIELAGTPEQAERWLAPMIAGETTLALAYQEAESGHAPERCDCVATRTADGFRLHGQKRWVLNGHAADWLVVSARLGGEIALFVVDPAASGVSRRSVQMIDFRRAAMLDLDNVVVAADQHLPAEDAAAVLEHVYDYGAAAAIAEGVGLMDAVLRMTVEYLKTREQFGQKIGAFQVLQHRAVEMFVECELTRSASIRALIRADDDPLLRRTAVSAAKAQLARGARWVTQQAIQLHGGIGITDEADVGLYLKRAVVLNTLFGDEDYHLVRFASLPTFAAERPDQPV
ncbi:MAG: acyl-CoA dehydrogenase family protein [Myxococcales bacterium]|nr:acyl-CoA dehydrogenase family protein [Myxococcales bacterium]